MLGWTTGLGQAGNGGHMPNNCLAFVGAAGAQTCVLIGGGMLEAGEAADRLAGEAARVRYLRVALVVLPPHLRLAPRLRLAVRRLR